MRISVFGLGYVGTVSAACLAKEGHTVVGVDPNPVKVDLINDGQSPIIETDVGAIIHSTVASGHLSALLTASDAILDTELSLICVGTPSAPNGSLDLNFVAAACREIGSLLPQKNEYHTVVVRSTVLPGTMRNLVIPTLEKTSGMKAGTDFGICNNPEFLREGTAIQDYYAPPKTVIGVIDDRSASKLEEIYGNLPGPLIKTNIETAELVKYVDNVWHALKVSFANEIGAICKPLAIDSHEVMDIFCKDTKLNISPYYLKPGFSFGGSCLPKDVRALNYEAGQLDLKLPIIDSIIESNRKQLERGIEMIMSEGRTKKVGILGFSFKAGTDDLRESPMVEVIERLIGKGFDIRLFDRNVQLAKLIGANRDFILEHIPHIANLMVDSLDEVLATSDVLVIGNADEEFKSVVQRANPSQQIIDFVRICERTNRPPGYQGIAW